MKWKLLAVLTISAACSAVPEGFRGPRSANEAQVVAIVGWFERVDNQEVNRSTNGESRYPEILYVLPGRHTFYWRETGGLACIVTLEVDPGASYHFTHPDHRFTHPYPDPGNFLSVIELGKGMVRIEAQFARIDWTPVGELRTGLVAERP